MHHVRERLFQMEPNAVILMASVLCLAFIRPDTGRAPIFHKERNSLPCQLTLQRTPLRTCCTTADLPFSGSPSFPLLFLLFFFFRSEWSTKIIILDKNHFLRLSKKQSTSKVVKTKIEFSHKDKSENCLLVPAVSCCSFPHHQLQNH